MAEPTGIDAALAVVDVFDAEPDPPNAWMIYALDVRERIRALVRQPDLMNQRGLNACAPAVFFRIWFARDPVAAATFACLLLRDGTASIGSLVVAPSWKLLAQDYARLRSVTDDAHPGSTPESADWLLLSGLRDSENVFFDYAGEPWTAADAAAGLTLPSTLASWLSATGLYSSVQDNTNLVATGDKQALLGLIPVSAADTVLFVNSAAISDIQPTHSGTAPGGSFFTLPNHYVLMTAPFIPTDDAQWVQMDVWSWGRTYDGYQGSERLHANYFGYLVATV